MTLRITKFTFVSFCLFVCSFCLFVCLFEHRVFKCSAKRKRGWSSEQSSFKIRLKRFPFTATISASKQSLKAFYAENGSQNAGSNNKVCRKRITKRQWRQRMQKRNFKSMVAHFQSSEWASIKCWLRNWAFSNFWEHWSQIRLSSSSNSKFVGILCACASGEAKESDLKAKQGRFESVFKGYRDNLQIACNLLHAAKI